MRCPSCGLEVEPFASACPHCGASLVDVVADVEQEQPFAASDRLAAAVRESRVSEDFLTSVEIPSSVDLPAVVEPAKVPDAPSSTEGRNLTEEFAERRRHDRELVDSIGVPREDVEQQRRIGVVVVAVVAVLALIAIFIAMRACSAIVG